MTKFFQPCASPTADFVDDAIKIMTRTIMTRTFQDNKSHPFLPSRVIGLTCDRDREISTRIALYYKYGSHL
jgi:hypothetical protein